MALPRAGGPFVPFEGKSLRMAKRDYYETLGVARGAGEDDIKKAFRKMAMEHHPDRNRHDPKSEARFKEVNEAYES